MNSTGSSWFTIDVFDKSHFLVKRFTISIHVEIFTFSQYPPLKDGQLHKTIWSTDELNRMKQYDANRLYGKAAPCQRIYT